MSREQTAAHDLPDPHNAAAEMAVLGAVIFDNGSFTAAGEQLGAEDFYAPAHQQIWTACADLILAGRVANGVTLQEYFAADEQMRAIGGVRYLANLLDSAAFGPEIRDYARMVRDLAVRRRMMAAAELLMRKARGGDAPNRTLNAPLLLAEASAIIDDVAVAVTPDRWTDSRLATVKSFTAAMRQDRPPAIETGIVRLDRKLGGLFRGDLIILGGRPSMGKSALCDQVETNVAGQRSPDPDTGAPPAMANEGTSRRRVVAKFSLEMGGDHLAWRNATRIAHAKTGEEIAYETLSHGRLTEQQARIVSGSLAHAPAVFWDTSPHIDLKHMRVALKRLLAKYGRLDLVTCDYLQLMEQQVEKGQTKADAVGVLSKGLKLIAREFDVPVLALSQLSRKVEEREDKRPQLADLRDSGSIEQDADVVLFCYREHYYLQRQAPPKDPTKLEAHEAALAEAERKMSVIIAKKRMGTIGDVDLHWSGASSFIVSELSELGGDQWRMAV